MTAMEIIKTTALITINETLWVQLILFLVFIFLINRVMFRPVQRNLADREADLLALRHDIHLLKEEMDALSDQAEAEEGRLRSAAQRAGDAMRDEGREEAERLMHEALADIKSIERAAEARLKASLASGRQQVEDESEQLAQSIIRHFLPRRIAP